MSVLVEFFSRQVGKQCYSAEVEDKRAVMERE